MKDWRLEGPDQNNLYAIYDDDGECIYSSIDEVEAELAMCEHENAQLKSKHIITIEIEGGCLIDVSGLPFGWDYELIDHDIEDEDEIYN